ncbi:MAG: hypothetical protein CSA33_07815 [Desulfobulbus propionicus]|nr:MAG: hypothetical protein CSA33_07815 [Desulfobulbus propionicus]
MGKILRNTIRVTDMAGRWGREEFCIIMPKTNAINAMSLLQRIQRNSSEYDFGIAKEITCSLSHPSGCPIIGVHRRICWSAATAGAAFQSF